MLYSTCLTDLFSSTFSLYRFGKKIAKRQIFIHQKTNIRVNGSCERSYMFHPERFLREVIGLRLIVNWNQFQGMKTILSMVRTISATQPIGLIILDLIGTVAAIKTNAFSLLRLWAFLEHLMLPNENIDYVLQDKIQNMFRTSQNVTVDVELSDAS